MASDGPNVGQVFQEGGIQFSFSNLVNLSESEITYPQFLACVAQRLLLKQYAAQMMDPNNVLCPISRTQDIFNKNKASFSTGINNLFMKPSTLAVINSQTSKNKVTENEQSEASMEFVKWYESRWFARLKSEELLKSLEDAFAKSSLKGVSSGDGDWETLSMMYSMPNESDLFEELGIDSKIFINNADSIEPRWFEDSLGSIMKFMELTGKVDLQSFSGFVSDGNLIVPTTSAFLLSTLYGIEEIEGKKKRYNAPLDPYNMFNTFKGTNMSYLLKMNQFVFTLYNYMKILL